VPLAVRARFLCPLVCAIWIGVTPTAATAQSEDAAVWIGMAVQGPVSPRLQLLLDATARFGDANTRQATRVIRPMIGYQLSKQVSLWVGYARVEQFPSARAPVYENRSFEQLSWNVGRLGRMSISARTRLEQRFFENGLGFALRVRQQVRLAIPLKGTKVSIVATTEPFLTLQSDVTGARHGLEQWRNSISFVAPVTEDISVEVGYLNRYSLHNSAPDGMDHIVPVTLAYHF